MTTPDLPRGDDDHHVGTSPDPHEHYPLLPRRSSDSGGPHAAAVAAAAAKTCAEFPLVPICLGVLMCILIDGGGVLQSIPLNQVLEDNICRSARASHRISGGATCGDSEYVQGELALVKGWKETLDLVPGMLTAIPYGVLADKYGRRAVLSLGIFGYILAQAFYLVVCRWPDVFPVRLTWLASAFLLIGGGSAVTNALLFSILSDITSEAQRTTIFLYVGGFALLSHLAFSPLAVSLMNVDLWLPIFLGFCLNFPGLAVVFCLPEGSYGKAAGGVPSESERRDPAAPRDTWGELVNWLRELRSTAKIFFRGHSFVALNLATLLLTSLGNHAHDITLQFARKRFGWSWGQAGLLVSLRAGSVVTLLFVLLPASSSVLTRCAGYQPKEKDFLLERISCVIMLIGTSMIGLSLNSTSFIVGQVIYCFGAGYSFLIRSLLSAVVETQHHGALFNAIAVLESTGAIIAGPILAATFRLGLKLQGMWTGLPFLVAACLFSAALIILLSARLPPA